MDDQFVEIIVKRKLGMGTALLRMLAVVLDVVLAYVTILILGILGITITALLIYLTYLLFVYTNVEYEYSFLNGELTVDKIKGQRSRKRMGEYDIRKADVVAPLDSDAVMRAQRNANVCDYSSGYGGDNLFAIIIPGEGTTDEIIFEPDEKMLDAMYHVRPSVVKYDRSQQG